MKRNLDEARDARKLHNRKQRAAKMNLDVEKEIFGWLKLCWPIFALVFFIFAVKNCDYSGKSKTYQTTAPVTGRAKLVENTCKELVRKQIPSNAKITGFEICNVNTFKPSVYQVFYLLDGTTYVRECKVSASRVVVPGIFEPREC